MKHSKTELYFLITLLSGIFILSFFIFKPFIFALILAIVFATVFDPIHKKALIITRERKGLAALLTTFFVWVASRLFRKAIRNSCRRRFFLSSSVSYSA